VEVAVPEVVLAVLAVQVLAVMVRLLVKVQMV
jgi:hypothetical protein